MGCLSSVEAPLCAIITVVFLVNSLYNITYKVLESQVPMDQEALDTKEMLMTALAIASLIGICSSRRAIGVFTLVFMLHAFIFSVFHLFHTVTLFIRSFDEPCRFLKASSAGHMTDEMCHAVNGITLVSNVISMIACAIATMSVFIRLTTVVVSITDMRKMATTREFDNSMPRLISQKSLESDREEDFPQRKMGRADIFV